MVIFTSARTRVRYDLAGTPGTLASEDTMRAFEKQIRIALTISLLAMFGSMLAGCASDSIAAPKHDDGNCYLVNGVLYCP